MTKLLYELVIETLTESGRIQRDTYTLEARSETEASNLAGQYSTRNNLINISEAPFPKGSFGS